MSEEQLIQGPPPLWLNEYQQLIGQGNGNWTAGGQYQKGPAVFTPNLKYPCTVFMGRWITSKDPDDEYPTTIHMGEYRFQGTPRMGMDV